jgi:hypothetical protein
MVAALITSTTTPMACRAWLPGDVAVHARWLDSARRVIGPYKSRRPGLRRLLDSWRKPFNAPAILAILEAGIWTLAAEHAAETQFVVQRHEGWREQRRTNGLLSPPPSAQRSTFPLSSSSISTELAGAPWARLCWLAHLRCGCAGHPCIHGIVL